MFVFVVFLVVDEQHEIQISPLIISSSCCGSFVVVVVVAVLVTDNDDDGMRYLPCVLAWLFKQRAFFLLN